MATAQLLGRGTYGPDVPVGRNISRLWLYFQAPPAQNSIIVYDDGTVVEQMTFDNDDIQAANVAAYILGGTDFRAEVGSSVYNALTAAGYTWRVVPERDTYTSDYTDVYP